MIGIIDLPQQRGTGIQGIIEECKAKGAVTAGDFVKYLNGLYKRTDKTLQEDSAFYSAIKLSENKIFIINNVSGKLEGTICTINEYRITIENNVVLTSKSFSGSSCSVVTLNENRVLIAYRILNSGKYELHIMNCIIQENLITIDNDIIVSSTTSTSYNAFNTVFLMKLDADNIFLICNEYSSSSTMSFYARIYTINETEISCKNTTLISYNVATGDYSASSVLLDKNKILILYGDKQFKLNGIVCTLKEEELTIGTNTELDNTINSGRATSVTLLDETRVFVASGYVDYLPSRVCVINNTDITVGETKQISSSSTGNGASAILLSTDKIFINYINHSSPYNLIGAICIIDGTTINIDKEISIHKFDSPSSAIIPMNTILYNDKIIIIYNDYNNNYLCNALVDYLLNVVEVATRRDNIYGIATTSAKDGQKVKVVKPEIKIEEEN